MTTDVRLAVDTLGRPVVLIGDHEYRVIAVEPYREGRRVRIERDGDEPGELVAQTVWLHPTDPARWECSCKDARYRRAQRPTGCKHCVHIRGYLRVRDAIRGK